jgi:hypothetical protein
MAIAGPPVVSRVHDWTALRLLHAGSTNATPSKETEARVEIAGALSSGQSALMRY